MALGNNLKRSKKDSLIPEKKKTGMANVVVKAKTKAKTTPKKAVAEKPIIKKKTTESAKQPRQTANLEEKILFGGKEDSPMTVKSIPSRRKSVRKTKLVCSGTLTYMEADNFKDCLLSTFDNYDMIDIQLQDVTELDLIPIQMISAFINHFPDKKIKVDSELPLDIKIIIERAGFGSLMFKEEAA